MSERRASCPNCGTEIVFRWSGAVQTTCPACRSILVRHDLNLEKVGKVADVPASMSGIQIGTEGRFKNQPFVVIGRIIYRYEAGHWSEWHIRFADDTSGWLSDAQAEYAVSRASATPLRFDDRGLGEEVRVAGKTFMIMSVTTASYAGVEGELPFEYWDKEEVRFFDLRGEGDSFATIDESESPPLLFVGEYESFEELRLRNLRDPADHESAAPVSKGLNCPSCGAAIVLRSGPLAQNVVCSACGSIIDAQDPNLAILQGAQAAIGDVSPDIPLGTVGKFKGVSWTVIGYQIRYIMVDAVTYSWREYLLWNAEAGFRYLTEYDDHWNDVTVVKGLPREVKGGDQPEIEYLGTRFKHFQSATARTRLVLGEFPWQVRVNDVVQTDDFVAPPLMLSREQTENEITWSMGTYTSPQVIKSAFNVEVRQPVGTFANQPNPRAGRAGELFRMYLVFVGLLFLLLIGRQVTARKEQAFTDGFRYAAATGDTVAFVTKLFELKGRKSNVEVRIATDVSNDWAYFNIALLPENGGSGYELGREVSYYFGRDSDGNWSEGSNSDRAIIPNVPPGRYYLRVEPEHEGMPTIINYVITVKRDVPRVWPFLVPMLILLLPPIFAGAYSGSFEAARWAESDHAPVASDDDDE